jgi:DNA modification methylase
MNEPHYQRDGVTLYLGDACDVLSTLPTQSAQTCVTSPPYWNLRDYGHEGQIGRESTVDEYVSNIVDVMRGVRRVLRGDGTLWLNLGDTYGKNKQLTGVPWLVAFALQRDGWILRRDVIWHKPNPLPENVKDRPTGSHEYVFLLSKSTQYRYDADAIAEPAQHRGYPTWETRKSGGEPIRRGDPGESGHVTRHAGLGGNGKTRNKRTVWTIAPKPYKDAHFATFPPALVEPCILAGSREGDTVLDPFAGSGTTGAVAAQFGRGAVLIDINDQYAPLIVERVDKALDDRANAARQNALEMVAD